MKAKFFSKVKILTLISIVAVSMVFVVLLQEAESDTTVYSGVPKAAIIDQLYDDIPNEDFQKKATNLLETAGFEVDIFTTNQVTVDFFKRLPEMNYQYVVVRTHGVIDQSEEDSVVLFTGEKYKDDSYISEQLFGQVKKGAPFLERDYQLSEHDASDWVQVNDTYRTITTPVNLISTSGDEYFLITSKFVDELMVGKFPQTTFLLGGCNTMANPSFAESLVKRGASNVVGWNKAVGSTENDWILLHVLEENLINNMTIEDAVNSGMEKFPKFMNVFDGVLKHYPGSSI